MSRIVFMIAAAILASAPLVAAGGAGNAERGKELYAENCTMCHGAKIHTRPDHFVRSLKKLREQVDRCQDGAELGWTEQQINDVVAYLNETYYQFK